MIQLQHYLREKGIKMNNETIHAFTIKQRGDHVYDIYADGTWVVSRGHPDNVLTELKKLMEEHNDD